MEKSLETVLGILLSKNVIVSGTYILITFIIVGILNHLSKKYRERIDEKDIRLRAFVRNVFNSIKGVVVTICIFAVLQANDINITSMITGVGVISAIAGLAMQDFFKDIIMGVHIVNDHSIVIGEVVEINGIEGIVLSFSLMTTVLKDLNTGNTVTMCNRNITQVSKVAGVYDIDLSLAYKEDPDRIREIFTKAARDIAKNKAITRAEYLGIQRYEDSGVIYRIRFYCSPKVHWPMWRAAMAIVQKYVIAANLEIPYPQLDVHSRENS